MKLGGITKRWALNTCGVVVFILIIIVIVSSVAFKSYYYETVYTALDSRSNEFIGPFFHSYGVSNDEGFASGAREFVESFAAKDMMEVWVIDRSGNVIVSSSGFQISSDEKIPDYSDAIVAENGRGEWVGTMASGEKVMAMTTTITTTGTRSPSIAGAVRYVISLEDIDAQLSTITLIISLICLLALILVILSGSFFIRSIVRPIQKIGETAKQIASGDLNARIDKYDYDDEIGILSETINNMASELSAAEKMKNDFISTISHELRTPLTAITGWGETLQQVGDTDAALTQRGMQIIIDESSRLSGLVEELLDFSKIQSGRMKLRMSKIDVLAELDDVVFTFKERAIKEGIELVYNVPHLPAPMDGDQGKISQVFINVLDNAIKYNNHGGKIIVMAEFVGTGSLEIAISDTGVGIPFEVLPRVKEKFYKADTSVRGSGIGLAVADEIVKLHGGTLEIDSIHGEGTTVTINLSVDPVDLENERSTDFEQET